MERRITTLIASGEHRDALEALAEAYGESAGRFITGLVGRPAEAEELLQEALIEALSAFPRFRGGSSVRTWFLGIARRVCIAHLRRRDRRRSLWGRFFAGAASESTATLAPDPVEQAETRDQLAGALLTLPASQREAVLLRYQSELSHVEVAAVLGISSQTARKRVSLGIAALRTELRAVLMHADASEPTQGETDEQRVSAPVGACHLRA